MFTLTQLDEMTDKKLEYWPIGLEVLTGGTGILADWAGLADGTCD